MAVFQKMTRGAIGIVLSVKDHLIAFQRHGSIIGRYDSSALLIGGQFMEDHWMYSLRRANDSARPLTAYLPYASRLRFSIFVHRMRRGIDWDFLRVDIQRLLQPKRFL